MQEKFIDSLIWCKIWLDSDISTVKADYLNFIKDYSEPYPHFS